MPTGGDTLIGLITAVASGIAGSAFTVPTRKEPELGWLAVKGWDWERCWLVFTIINVALNAILAQAIFGLDVVFSIYSRVSRATLLAVLLSSSLWAAGTLLFGKGVEMSGVALGVGLAMTSQIIFGTSLPFINDPATAKAAFATPKGPLIVLGIVIACLGFAVLGRASWLRDHPGRSGVLSVQEAAGSDEEKAELTRHVKNKTTTNDAKGASQQIKKKEEGEMPADTRKLWLGVCISLFAGLFSALLQFAFIYGSEVVDMVEMAPYKASHIISSAIIFTVSTAVNNFVQSLWMCYLVTIQGKWDFFKVEGAESWTEFWRNVGRCLIMSILLNVHIECYGLSQAYMGAMGPVVAWPLIMSLVVLMSQVWGHILKEWTGAPRFASILNWASIGVVLLAVIVLGISAKFS